MQCWGSNEAQLCSGQKFNPCVITLAPKRSFKKKREGGDVFTWQETIFIGVFDRL